MSSGYVATRLRQPYWIRAVISCRLILRTMTSRMYRSIASDLRLRPGQDLPKNLRGVYISSPMKSTKDVSTAGELELSLARAALVLGMRCANAHMRHKWQGLIARLLQRLHDSSAAAAARVRVRAAGGAFGKNMRKAFSADTPEADKAGVLFDAFHYPAKGRSFACHAVLNLGIWFDHLFNVLRSTFRDCQALVAIKPAVVFSKSYANVISRSQDCGAMQSL